MSAALAGMSAHQQPYPKSALLPELLTHVLVILLFFETAVYLLHTWVAECLLMLVQEYLCGKSSGGFLVSNNKADT